MEEYAGSAIVKDIHLFLEVNFDQTILFGNVNLTVERQEENNRNLILDTRDLKIHSVTDFVTQENLNFKLTEANFGSTLNITLSNVVDNEIDQDANVKQIVNIKYETSSTASGLQWLPPEQTSGKTHPFLFSQCQAIHCRSIIPCQDTPCVKCTYSAEIIAPGDLTVLMSAHRIGEPQLLEETGKRLHKFQQKLPIPSYLIAIAVGLLESRKLGRRCSVWAEKEMIDKAEYEFAETPELLNCAENYLGRYEWEVYDLLVLPPSFPFGGMENPCLTFVTPTLIAGDRSLCDVIIHEITHSWTGNLVTNCGFEHFWLNEGFTKFVERKLLGMLRGEPQRFLSAIEGLNNLSDAVIRTLGEDNPLTCLVPDLNGIDPDDAFSVVPYEKGHTFLFYIETLVGGAGNMDRFLRCYIEKFKYQSIKTEDFKKFLYAFFPGKTDLEQIDWETWLYKPGMPPVIPDYDRTLLNECEALARKWLDCELENDCPFSVENAFKASDVTSLTPRQIQAFLSILLQDERILTHTKLTLLNQVYNFDNFGNCEIKFKWLRLGLKSKWPRQIPLALNFVNSQGRMKYVRPLYRDLYAWEESRDRAIENYNENKINMMHVTASQLLKDLHLDV